MRFLVLKVFSMALGMILLQGGYASAAENGILRQLEGKSVVYRFTMSVDGRNSPARGIVYFSKNGDIFHYVNKDTGRKILRGKSIGSDKGGSTKISSNKASITITSTHHDRYFSIITKLNVNVKSCSNSTSYSTDDADVKRWLKVHSFQCWIESGRQKL